MSSSDQIMKVIRGISNILYDGNEQHTCRSDKHEIQRHPLNLLKVITNYSLVLIHSMGALT